MEELDLETRQSRNTLEQSHWHGDTSASASCKGGNGTVRKHSQECFAQCWEYMSDWDGCAGVISMALLPPQGGFSGCQGGRAGLALLGWPWAEWKGLFVLAPGTG